MTTQRKIVFANESYYHVFNRGIDRRPTFLNKREYERALQLLNFYQYATIPIRFSRFSELTVEMQEHYFNIMMASGKVIEVVAYCLMPNHFHLLLKQKKEKGLATYVSNFVNAYTKYFNTKHERTGPLFQGVFKAVFVESDEQLIHLTRYIHINTVVSNIIELKDLQTYPWSSYPAYIGVSKDPVIDADTIAMIRSFVPDYKSFVFDQVAYAKQLEKIKHLTLE